MIWLADDCLVFELQNGESVPLSVNMISFESVGETGLKFDPEFIHDVAASVFYYFKHDLEREAVSVGEFAVAMEKALRERGCQVQSVHMPGESNSQGDLLALADESADGGELLFFKRLRDALLKQLDVSPDAVRFQGLRGCVKRLLGARRWNMKCEQLQEQIVDYLRQLFSAEARRARCSLMVK